MSTLVMPTQYVEVTEEEMLYLDGGFSIHKAPVAFAINCGIAAITGGGGVKLLVAFIKRKGSGVAKTAFKNVLKKFVATQVANRVSGLVIGAISGFLSFSVGNALTTLWDRNDSKRNNGYLNAI